MEIGLVQLFPRGIYVYNKELYDALLGLDLHLEIIQIGDKCMYQFTDDYFGITLIKEGDNNE